MFNSLSQRVQILEVKAEAVVIQKLRYNAVMAILQNQVVFFTRLPNYQK